MNFADSSLLETQNFHIYLHVLLLHLRLGYFLHIIRQPNARIISIKNHKIKWNSSCLCSIFESFSFMVGVRKKFQRHQIKRQRWERITSSVMEFENSSAFRLCKSIQYSAEFSCSTTGGVWKLRRNYKNLQFKMSRKRKMFFTKKSGEGGRKWETKTQNLMKFSRALFSRCRSWNFFKRNEVLSFFGFAFSSINYPSIQRTMPGL